MLDFISDAFRHRGPVGGLFVAMMILLVGGPLVLWPILASSDLAGPFLVALVASLPLLLLVWLRRRRVRGSGDQMLISTWPKLGQNDRHAARSKLTQPVKRK